MTTRTLCGSDGARAAHVYVSEASSVEVRVVSKVTDDEASKAYFLLHYEGRSHLNILKRLNSQLSHIEEAILQ